MTSFFEKYKSEKSFFPVPLFLDNIQKKWRRFDLLNFVTRRERIGGLVIREGAAELALWDRFRREGGSEGYALLLHKTMDLAEGTISEGKIVNAENLRHALAELRMSAAKFSLESVVLSLPSSLAQFTILNFPPNLSKKEIGEAVYLAIESTFPVSSQQLFFDYVVSEGHDVQKLEVIVAAARKKDVDVYMEIVSGSGFSSVAVETHSMSLARIFSLDDQDRFAIFLEPSEVIAVVYNRGMPHIQVQTPRFILEEDADHKSVEEKIADIIERVIHSAVSGNEELIVDDIVIVPDEEDHWGLKPFLEKRSMPVVADLTQSINLPSAVDMRDGWMAVALGAAQRGLIPRKNDTIVSIMDVGTELAYERARKISLIDFLQKFSISFGFFLVMVFLATSFFVSMLVPKAGETIDEEGTLSSRLREIREAASVFNQRVGAVAELERSAPRWEYFLTEADKIRVVGIVFSRIEVTPDRAISIYGRAANRDALLLMKAVLENSSIFNFDPLPLVSFLEKENIAFNLKLTLKDPQKVFP